METFTKTRPMKNFFLKLFLAVAPACAYAQQSDTVRVNYSGDAVAIEVNNDSVTATADGSYVTIESLTAKDHEITVVASGESGDGGMLFKGSCKLTLVFDGLSLTSQRGAAIDIESGKRINIVIADGTTNTLADLADGDQKACLYVKGHAEVKHGTGTLYIKGNSKHAFSAKEYIEMKDDTGTIVVVDAVKDGLHSGEYIDMKGGTVDVRSTGDDALSADADFTMSAGTVKAVCAAAGGKDIKSEQNVSISGGMIDILTTGDSAIVIEDGVPDTVKCAGIRANGDVLLSGGSLKLKSTGLLGRCLSIDGVTTFSDNVYVEMLTEAGEGIQSDMGIVVDGGTINGHCYDDVINSAASITINGGRILAVSTDNDAIDSNLRAQGAVTINGGVVLAMSIAPKHEEGIDCNRKKIVVTGGWLFTTGKKQLFHGEYVVKVDAKQPVALLDSLYLSEGDYYTLVCEGLPLYTVRMPGTVNDDVSLLSSPGMTVGGACTLQRSHTAPTSYSDSYFDCFWTYPVVEDAASVRTWTHSPDYYNELDKAAGIMPIELPTKAKQAYTLDGRPVDDIEAAHGVVVIDGKVVVKE